MHVWFVPCRIDTFIHAQTRRIGFPHQLFFNVDTKDSGQAMPSHRVTVARGRAAGQCNTLAMAECTAKSIYNGICINIWLIYG